MEEQERAPPPARGDNDNDDGSSDSSGNDSDSDAASSSSEDEAMVPTSVDHSLLLLQVAAARQAMQQRAPERAAPLLLRTVHTMPELLPELEGELAQALSEYAGALVGQGKAREALWLLDGATRSLPQAKLLWLEQGRLCFRLRQHLRALRSFQRALALDPRFHAALDAFESLKSLSVDRWHFRMLVRVLISDFGLCGSAQSGSHFQFYKMYQNDRPRNEAYRRALQRVVAEEASRLGRKPVVLDIGLFARLPPSKIAVRPKTVADHSSRTIIQPHLPRHRHRPAGAARAGGRRGARLRLRDEPGAGQHGAGHRRGARPGGAGRGGGDHQDQPGPAHRGGPAGARGHCRDGARRLGVAGGAHPTGPAPRPRGPPAPGRPRHPAFGSVVVSRLLGERDT